jgi:hypothetical protein
MELFLSLFFGISVISILYLLNQARSASLTEAISLNIITLRRGENTDISEVFDVKCAKCYACPRDFMIGRPGDIETRRHNPQHSHTACPVARRGMGSLRGGSRTATDAAISGDTTGLTPDAQTAYPSLRGIRLRRMTKQSQVLQAAFQDSQPRHL